MKQSFSDNFTSALVLVWNCYFKYMSETLIKNKIENYD